MKYEMIASDLDWTLVYDINKINERNLSALKKYLSNNFPFVIITGRPNFMGIKLLKDLHLDTYPSLYLAGYNGSVIYSIKDHESINISEKLTKNEVIKLNELASKYKLNLLIYEKDSVYIKDIYDYRDKSISLDKITVIEKDSNILNKIDNEIHKCIIASDKEKIDLYLDEFKKSFPELDFYYSQKFYLEVMKKGVNKSLAIDYMSKKLNIPKEKIIAIGDSENDIFMFKEVGKSYAMDNAEDNIKKYATKIAKDVHDNSLEEIIKENFNI